jgi:hypothetical protein
MSDSDEDAATLATVHAALGDPKAFASKLIEYYADADRADRTSRSMMYLHLGQCLGVIARLLEERDPQTLAAALKRARQR